MITFTLIRCRREINMHVAIWLKWLMMRFLGVFCLTRPGETYTAERFQLLVFCHKLQKWRLMFQFFRCSVADVCRKSRDNVLLELSGGRSEHNSLRRSRSLYFRLLHVRLCARVYWAAWNGGANLLSARNSDLDLFQDLTKNGSMSNLLFSTPTLCRTCVGPAIEFLSDMTHRAVCGPDNTRPRPLRLQRPGVSVRIHTYMNVSTAQTMILSSYAHTLCPMWLTVSSAPRVCPLWLTQVWLDLSGVGYTEWICT